MQVQTLCFSGILRDEYEDSSNVAYKNAPKAPRAFEDSEEDKTDSDPYCGGKTNPTFWVNNRRAIKILNYEEQQEDDDIVCIIRRTRKLMGSEAVCKLSKELQVRKQVDFKNDGEDGDIVTDRYTHICGY
ncbi:hypothetical protein IscW_ISCW021176 [Ixodes scapularis]|uniref:Uncharacterized protein n=1 Tax=Ixodes scapularis TaxID=6945 RepID=B7Q6F6_IXOSC|nr:hypothetical protein IscW_ISCW021176 [Ixodes scapularis]|eukprot:XP_002402948.1 hypothetical protein IscW_ISCW021176 [Ixodes scapularis]